MEADRLRRLTTFMLDRGIDAVALVPGPNLFYLTGLQMHLSERLTLAVLTGNGAGWLLLPGLEEQRARSALAIPLRLITWNDEQGSAGAWSTLSRELDLSGKKLAVEFLNMRVLELYELRAIADHSEFLDAGLLLSDLRIVKDEEEADAMRRAAGVIDASLQRLLALIKPGISERELAFEWQLSMSRCGADSIPEQPIVASGPNSAAPHIEAGHRKLQTGDLVVFDGWCQVERYFTDITRTVAVGQISDSLGQVYDAVKRGNEAARRVVAPGVTCEQVDRAAREVIAGAGWGEHFIHRTGHGLGLEVHEAPAIVAGNALPLRAGMTFTIEPGIYLPGQGGVRIEDDLLVTQDGAETLTRFPRDLMVL